MKLNILHHALLLAATLLAASCSQDEFTPTGASKISISITDAGFAASDGTRAVDNGFQTTFTAGDACGLYIMGGMSHKMYASNVKLIATTAADGSLTWQTADGSTLYSVDIPNLKFLIYYPYRDDTYMADKVNTNTSNPGSFFSKLVDSWDVAADQTDYADYTNSDLMLCAGTATKHGDDYALSFNMYHTLSLVVIDAPKTVYKFTDSRISDYTVPASIKFADSSAKPFRASDGTYRFLTNVHKEAPTFAGSYDDGAREFSFTASDRWTLHYHTYIIDDAATTTKQHNLQTGDYILANGNLLSKDADAATIKAADIAGIVYWTAAQTNKFPDLTLTDDRIMNAEHPTCTHGLAVAVNDASTSTEWQQTAQKVADFQASDQFVHPMKSEFQTVASICSIGEYSEVGYKILGYQNSQVLKAYNKFYGETSATAVLPIIKIQQYAAANPAPATSTGWFLPSAMDLFLVFENYIYADACWAPKFSNHDTLKIVCKSLAAAGLDKIDQSCNCVYWSSTECLYSSREAASYDHDDGGLSRKPKDRELKVRAVCAF